MCAASPSLAASADAIRLRNSARFAEESAARRSSEWLSSMLPSFLEKSRRLVVAQRFDLEDEEILDDLRYGRDARIVEEAP